MIPRLNILSICFILVLLLTPGLCIAQDAKDVASQGATQAKVETGEEKNLGGFFASTLQDILKQGKFFYPSDMAKQPGEGEDEGAEESEEEKTFKLNFKNAQIDQVLKFITEMTGKVVMRTDEVKGQFTIVNPKEVTQEEAMRIIDTAFMLKGITYLETDMMFIVLTVAEAKQKGVEVSREQQEGDMSSSMQHRIIELKYATPSQLQEALESLISENGNIIADDRTRTLVITETVQNLERINAIIQQLDQENIMEDVVVKVFQLNYLDAREISRDLDDIVESLVGAQMAGGRSGRNGYRQVDVTTEVMADRATNSLIITAPKLAVEQLEKFINSLDSSAADRIVIRTFPLKNGDATEIAQILSEMARSRRTNFYQPTVAADSRTNSIIVAAYESDVKMVKDLIDQLDNDQSLDKETRSYKLENADAIIVKEMMEQLLSDENQNSRYSYYYYRRNSGDQDQIRIVEDQRLNAIFVTAKPQEFPMIERLIEQLDQPIPQSMEEPRVFPVENVRASDLAYLINQLFEEDTGGGRSYFSYYSRGRDQQMMTGLTGKVKVTADPMTNSLIVISGTPRAFGIVESLIEQLDSVSNLGDTRVFQLQNADCTYLAEQLNALFEEDSQAANRGFWFFDQPSQQSESDFSQLIGNVRIVSETRTNSLLVTTNSQYFPAVEQIIEDLDQENEQVLIEILIVELIDSDSNNLGIDWDGNIPVSVNGNYDSSFNNLNIANAAILSDAKFDMVLNFLGRNERTNVVARPNIFTRDNQQAYVEVTTRVPVVTEVAISNNTVVPSIEYEDVGLKLTVNPQINSATRVTIDVDLENGQVLENLGLDTQGFTIPALSQRQIQTMLTIENQETAVLSGVIDTTEIESEKGIPGLMHIPLLGNLFKSRKKEQTKTELITFITPYILADIQDRKSILQMHNDRLKRIEDLGPIDHGLIKTGIGE